MHSGGHASERVSQWEAREKGGEERRRWARNDMLPRPMMFFRKVVFPAEMLPSTQTDTRWLVFCQSSATTSCARGEACARA